MKKSELINFLNKFPQDFEIGLIVPDCGGYDATIEEVNIEDIEIAKNIENNIMFISTKNSSWKDCDFYETIKENEDLAY